MDIKQQEFIVQIAVYGGIALAGILVVIVLTFYALRIKSNFNRKMIERQIYEQKRENGQSKKTKEEKGNF